MEPWRLLVSTGALLLVWAVIVTVLGEPPTPAGIIGATILGAAGIYVSDWVVKEYVEPYAEGQDES